MLDTSAIRSAGRRLQPYVRRTPTLHLDAGELGRPAALKLEFLQHSGSFKARGAFNRLLTAPELGNGVVAASGGNHGAAVAYAAQRLDVRATIFVPEPTPAAKLARIRSYGAELRQVGANYAEAHEASRIWAAPRGAAEVHAYDDEAVLEGQGTVALELDHDAPGLTHVLVAVGGGGLIGGIGAWHSGAGTQVIAVEPESCPTLHAALAAGRPVPVAVGGVAADSLGARQAGQLGFAVAQHAGVSAVLVEDAAISAAQAWLWERLRIVAEPGGAAALAALLSARWSPPTGARVGVILCGANTNPASVTMP